MGAFESLLGRSRPSHEPLLGGAPGTDFSSARSVDRATSRRRDGRSARRGRHNAQHDQAARTRRHARSDSSRGTAGRHIPGHLRIPMRRGVRPRRRTRHLGRGSSSAVGVPPRVGHRYADRPGRTRPHSDPQRRCATPDESPRRHRCRPTPRRDTCRKPPSSVVRLRTRPRRREIRTTHRVVVGPSHDDAHVVAPHRSDGHTGAPRPRSRPPRDVTAQRLATSSGVRTRTPSVARVGGTRRRPTGAPASTGAGKRSHDPRRRRLPNRSLGARGRPRHLARRKVRCPTRQRARSRGTPTRVAGRPGDRSRTGGGLRWSDTRTCRAAPPPLHGDPGPAA